MVLTVVIPALNEEQAIGDTIARCLEARSAIIEATNLTEIELIVVSDGSTDRTVEIANGFSEVDVIVFKENRGYGAAIKEGFRQGRGDLLGFLDADGTCDPIYFAGLCNAIERDNADIALGSRLGPRTKMPLVRRIGNRFYALLLGFLCGRSITDTASGMRVIRRESLSSLYPLPDGLHFTPAMSARALLNGMRIAEVPMTYEERVGRSKLSVVHDGVRFMRAIFSGVLCYRPERLFLLGFLICLLFGAALAAFPVEFYLRNRVLEEWMIYRFLVCFLTGTMGFTLLCSSALAHNMAMLGPQRREGPTFWMGVVSSLFQGKAIAMFVLVFSIGSFAIVSAGVAEYLGTSHLTMHWSRAVVAGFGMLVAFQALVTTILLQVLNIWKRQDEVITKEPIERPSTRKQKEITNIVSPN